MPLELSQPSDRGADSIRTETLQQRNALRALLELPLLTAIRRLANDGDFDRSALREELQHVCAAAKLSGVRAEQVVIAVREIWAALPMARDVERNASGKPIFSQVVRMTLDEYYDGAGGRT
jgi:hypothetical protein